MIKIRMTILVKLEIIKMMINVHPRNLEKSDSFLKKVLLHKSKSKMNKVFFLTISFKATKPLRSSWFLSVKESDK